MALFKTTTNADDTTCCSKYDCFSDMWLKLDLASEL